MAATVRARVEKLIFSAAPEWVLRAVLRDGPPFEGIETRAAVTAPPGECRLLVAPLNTAGQATRWARAAELIAGVGARSWSAERGIVIGWDFDSDESTPLRTYRWSKSWQHAQRRAVASGFTHVLMESGTRMFGDYFYGSAAGEISWMRREGLVVGLLWHGSDVRSPALHAQHERWSPFIENSAERRELELVTQRSALLAARTDVPQFVSTPDLLHDVPHATWLPVVVVDEGLKGAAGQWLTRPLVVHVPSSAFIKGTDLVDRQLRSLHAERVIDYVMASGLPASEVAELYARADIIVDQFRIGNYGVAAVEAMMMGKVVVSHVSQQVRTHVRQTTGEEPPIVEATPDTIIDVITGLAANRAATIDLSQRGRAFAQAVHNGAASARALAPFLNSREGEVPA